MISPSPSVFVTDDPVNLPEAQKSASRLSDKSRRISLRSEEMTVPHKFKETGEVVTEENFNPRTDLSRLTLNHWQLLEAMKKTQWNMEKACEQIGMDVDKAKKLFKRIRYFEFEESREKALAALLNPDFVASRHVENVLANNLEDGQRDSLKELAKITGAYKQVNPTMQVNVFNLPELPPEQATKVKEFFDTIALESENAA